MNETKELTGRATQSYLLALGAVMNILGERKNADRKAAS